MADDTPLPDLDGWDRTDGDRVTLVRRDRRAKITFKTLTFADRRDGWMAKLWVKNEPHGRSHFAGEAAHNDPIRFKQMVRELAAEAP